MICEGAWHFYSVLFGLASKSKIMIRSKRHHTPHPFMFAFFTLAILLRNFAGLRFVLFQFCFSFVHFCSCFVQLCTVKWKVFCHENPFSIRFYSLLFAFGAESDTNRH
jgi:hypothetical protein